MNPSSLKVVGFDPSLRNWGMASGLYLPDGSLTLDRVGIAQTTGAKASKMRQNDADIAAAIHLYHNAALFAQDADAVFVEVPHGSKSAAAMKGYGICIGLLAALRASGVHFYRVTVDEVKLIATGNVEATKKEMIGWATTKYPQLNWPLVKNRKRPTINESLAEHPADACAAIEAGVILPAFLEDLPSLLHRKQHGYYPQAA